MVLVQVIHRALPKRATVAIGEKTAQGVTAALRQRGVGLLLGVAMAAAMTGIYAALERRVGRCLLALSDRESPWVVRTSAPLWIGVLETAREFNVPLKSA